MREYWTEARSRIVSSQTSVHGNGDPTKGGPFAGEESNLSLAVLLQGSIRVVSSKCLVCHIRTIMSR
jgi:hypothetical protein